MSALGLVEHHGRHIPSTGASGVSGARPVLVLGFINGVESGQRDGAKSKNPGEANNKKIT